MMFGLILYFLSLLSVVTAAPFLRDVDTDVVEVRSLGSDVSKRQSLSTTRNELGLCRPVTVIFARGTIELGNVGNLAGPPFFNALDLALGAENVGVQGVPYPASIIGYLEGGDKGGAAKLAALAEEAASTCPDTQIVLSGYRFWHPLNVQKRSTNNFVAKGLK